MARMTRILNVTITPADAFQKVFDIENYKDMRIYEVKVKLRETSTADHFRYNFDGSTTVYMTSTGGFAIFKNIRNLWVYVPTVDSQVLEMEILYE